LSGAGAYEQGTWRYFQHGDFEQVRADIKAGWDVSQKTSHGRYPIRQAVAVSDLKVIKLLLDSGASLTSVRESEGEPLHIASGYNFDGADVLKFLLENDANLEFKDQFGKTPLFEAVDRNSLKVIKLLVEAGADYTVLSNDGSNLLHIAANRSIEMKEVCEYLISLGIELDLKNKYGSTPLNEACLYDRQLDGIRCLVEAGADVNNIGNTGSPLHSTSSSIGAAASVRYLLEKGADVGILCDGEQPIHRAAARGDLETIKTLVEFGASPVAEGEYGITPLHEAAKMNSDPNVIKYFVSEGGDINGIGLGSTPLHYAAEYNENPNVVEAILNMGGDPNMVDSLQRTTLKLASSNEHLSGSNAIKRLMGVQTVEVYLPSFPNALLDRYFLENLDWSKESAVMEITSEWKDWNEENDTYTFFKESTIRLSGHELRANLGRHKDGTGEYNFLFILMGYELNDIPRIIDYFTSKLGKPDSVQGFAQYRKSADWLIGGSHVKIESNFVKMGDSFYGMPCMINIAKAGRQKIIKETLTLHFTGEATMMSPSGVEVRSFERQLVDPFVLVFDLESNEVFNTSMTGKHFEITEASSNRIQAVGLSKFEGTEIIINRITGTYEMKFPKEDGGNGVVYLGSCEKISNTKTKF
jgi:ankyrin repeat protein